MLFLSNSRPRKTSPGRNRAIRTLRYKFILESVAGALSVMCSENFGKSVASFAALWTFSGI